MNIAELLKTTPPIDELREPIYISHRGEALNAPEGARPAYRLTMEHNLPCVKLDVHFTEDRKIIMSHDESLMRTCGWPGLIRDQTYESLLKNAVFKTVSTYAGEHIVTLQEALDIVRNCPIFYIDFKNDYSPEILEAVLKVLKDYKIDTERVIFPNFEYDTLASIKSLHPEVKTLLHLYYKVVSNGVYRLPWKNEEDTRATLAASIIAYARNLKLFGVSILGIPTAIGRDIIAPLQDAGLWVPVWIINDVPRTLFFYHEGANAFVTDCGDILGNAVRAEILCLRRLTQRH